MTRRVSFCGIDGTGKSTAISGGVEKLSHLKIAVMDRPGYISLDGKREPLFEKFNSAIEKMHNFFDDVGNRPGIVAANGAYVMMQPDLERKVVKSYSPDIILAARDMTVCPSVYLAHYFPTSSYVPAALRLSSFHMLRRQDYPDKIIYLDADPSIAEERINNRACINNMAAGNAGNLDNINNMSNTAWKKKQRHECSESLLCLRNHYFEALEILDKQDVKIDIIDTTHRSIEEVVNMSADLIKSVME